MDFKADPHKAHKAVDAKDTTLDAKVAAKEGDLRDLGSFVEAYEGALAQGNEPDLAAYLPPPEHPLRRDVLCELICIDLERGWKKRTPRSLEHYRQAYPELFTTSSLVREVVSQECRLRAESFHEAAAGMVLDGDLVATCWHSIQVQNDNEGFASLADPPRLFHELCASAPDQASRLVDALNQLPEVGGEFLGFQLVSELGRGAFSRVFLARQVHLANRLVVLKIAPDQFRESQNLAQLQHTNIVPIYSVHGNKTLQAVCMPYLGTRALNEVLLNLQFVSQLKHILGSEADTASLAGLVALDDHNTRSHRLNRPVQYTSGQPVEQSAGSGGDLPAGQLVRPELQASAQRSPQPSVNSRSQLGRSSPVDTSAYAVEQSKFNADRSGFTYVEAILWIMTRVAYGLAHAHERGILHRDLKPANILLTDNGEPMLLDFNLSEDTKITTPMNAAIGGTLPYMSPEHLRAFRNEPVVVGVQADIYALGVILYELLTSKAPYPIRTGSLAEVLPQMIRDRQNLPVSVRVHRPQIAVGVARIIERCLAPEAKDRYLSARQLQEDLRNQLEGLPLKYTKEPFWVRARKWARLHPRLLWISGLMLVVLVAIGLTRHFALESGLANLAMLREFEREAFEVQLVLNTRMRTGPSQEAEQARKQALRALDRYNVLQDPFWTKALKVSRLPQADRRRLLDTVGELLLLLARECLKDKDTDNKHFKDHLREAELLNQRADSCYPSSPRAVLQQRARIFHLSGHQKQAQATEHEALEIPLRNAAEYYAVARELVFDNQYSKAKDQLELGLRENPQHPWSWFLLSYCQYELGSWNEAIRSLTCFIVLQPEFAPGYLERGQIYHHLHQLANAEKDFTQALELQPHLLQALLYRAQVREEQGKAELAQKDLDELLKQQPRNSRAWLVRARCHQRLGNTEQAARDQAMGLRILPGELPSDAEDWVVRGLALEEQNPEAAVWDYFRALELRPGYEPALQNIAALFSEQLGWPEGALVFLKQASERSPRYPQILQGRTVLHARLGARREALDDVEKLLHLDASAASQYAVACTYALLSRHKGSTPSTDPKADRHEALYHLRIALEETANNSRATTNALRNLARTDSDLTALHQERDWQRLLAPMPEPR